MTSLKQRAPHRLKVAGRRVSVEVGRRTAAWRMLPAFVLAGGQRCGSTSLFRALIEHPSVLQPVFHKGVNYFDLGYDRGMPWYQGHFPLTARGAWTASRTGTSRAVTFDASGYYLYHPHAPGRIAKDLPGVKVLVMLRDPVERAYSAYRHERARGFEDLSFERALEMEDRRVGPEVERMMHDPGYASESHRHHSYRRRGLYAEQLKRMASHVGRENVHVVDSQSFFTRPQDEHGRVLGFLGLERTMPSSFERWNARPGSPISPWARDFLEQAYAGPDQELAEFLGWEPSWRS